MKIRIPGLQSFLNLFKNREKELRRKALEAGNRCAVEWQKEAKIRVPVDTGLTRNTILASVELKGDKLTVAVGSNQKHAKYIEFGTQYIAGGKVQALGRDPEITDRQAVHDWPAKSANAIGSTSASVDSKGRLRNGRGRSVEGARASAGQQEQMPWLRPAFVAIKPKVIRLLGDVLRPNK